MKNSNVSDNSNFTDVRYSKSFGLIILIGGLFFLIISMVDKPAIIMIDRISQIALFCCGAFFILFGISTFFGKKYFRLDKQKKLIIVYSHLPFITITKSKRSFNKIYTDVKGIYIQTNERVKKLNISLSVCDKSDLAVFTQEILDN